MAKAARERFSEVELLEEYWKIASDPKQSGAARVSALNSLANRGWGMPASHAAVEGHDPLGMSPVDEELTQLAAAMEKERHELLAARDDLSARRNARGAPKDPSKADTATG